jgi:hypothetical protein
MNVMAYTDEINLSVKLFNGVKLFIKNLKDIKTNNIAKFRLKNPIINWEDKTTQYPGRSSLKNKAWMKFQARYIIKMASLMGLLGIQPTFF